MKSFKITNRVIIGISVILAYVAFTIAINYIKDPLNQYLMLDYSYDKVAFDTMPFLLSTTFIYIMLGIKIFDWFITLLFYPSPKNQRNYPLICKVINIIGIFPIPFIAIYTALVPYWIELATKGKTANELPFSQCVKPDWIILITIVATACILSIIADIFAIIVSKSNTNSILIQGVKATSKSLWIGAIPVFVVLVILYYPARLDKLFGGNDWTKDMLVENCNEIRAAIELDNGGVDTTYYFFEYGEVLYDDIEESISFFGTRIKLTYCFVNTDNNEVLEIGMIGKREFGNRYSWKTDGDIGNYITDYNGMVFAKNY